MTENQPPVFEGSVSIATPLRGRRHSSRRPARAVKSRSTLAFRRLARHGLPTPPQKAQQGLRHPLARPGGTVPCSKSPLPSYWRFILSAMVQIRLSRDLETSARSARTPMTVDELLAHFPEVPRDLRDEPILAEYVKAFGPLLRVAQKPSPCMGARGDAPQQFYTR